MYWRGCLPLAPIVHCLYMGTDTTLVYFGAAVQLAGLNRFYTRRVLQRCERGEITLLDAAQLLMSAAQSGNAKIECVGVRTMSK